MPGAIVSPGDGKVTDVSTRRLPAEFRAHRISIFLNVFDVHVNRSPIAGVIRDVRYQRGKFLNAMGANSAEENEQNIVTVEGEGRTVIFKQIAGLIARRIVFNLKVGDHGRPRPARWADQVRIACGCSVRSDAAIQVKLGDRVKGGASVLALLPVAQAVRASPSLQHGQSGRLTRIMEELNPAPSRIRPSSRTTAQGHVHSAFAVHHRQYCGRILRHSADRPRHCRRSPGTWTSPPWRSVLPYCSTASTAASRA